MQHRCLAVRSRGLAKLDDEQAIRDAFDWHSDLCPLPGHAGFAFLEHRHRSDDPDEPDLWFACDCLGHSAPWDVRDEWPSVFWRPLSEAYWSIRSCRKSVHCGQRGALLSRGSSSLADAPAQGSRRHPVPHGAAASTAVFIVAPWSRRV